MAISLYRTYRPRTFDEVVGQRHVTTTLRNQITQGSVGHAYLFSGPRGIGKTTMARLLAKAVNCPDVKKDDPTAEAIMNGKSMDVVEIDAASHTGVDHVREQIIDRARFRPSQLPYKVFIIDEVHMLSTSAFNALLKVLEEPPAHVMFILATTEAHKIPATIVSRCQRFVFTRIPQADVVDHLAAICKQEKVQCEEAVLQAIARQSEGYLRDALSLLSQVLALGEKKITMEQASLVIPRSDMGRVVALTDQELQHDTAGGLGTIQQLIDDGISLKQFTQDWLEFLRLVMHARVTDTLATLPATVGEISADTVERLTAVPVQQVANMIETIIAKTQQLAAAPLPQMGLEVVVVTLASTEPAPPVAPAAATPVATQSAPAASKPAAAQKAIKSTTPPPPADPVVTKEAPAEQPAQSASAPARQSATVSLQDITTVWPKVIAALHDSHHSLSLILKLGKPIAVNGNEVTLGFQFALHADRVNQADNSLTVSKIFSTMLDAQLTVAAAVSEEVKIELPPEPAQSAAPATDTTANDVAAMFGGQVA